MSGPSTLPSKPFLGAQRMVGTQASEGRSSTGGRRVEGDTPEKKHGLERKVKISNDLHIPNSLKYLKVPLKTPEIQSWFQRQETKRLSGLVCILAGQL